MRPPRKFLTVVIPAYNEAERLQPSLEKIRSFLSSENLDAEILVVDDGSTDGTAELAERFFASPSAVPDGRKIPGRVVRNPGNRGKGYAVRHGVREAVGRWVLFSDADLSTPIEDYRRLAETARERDRDLVFGSRALSGSNVEIRQHGLRQWMGKTFNFCVKTLAGLPFHDTQCGFKLLDRERVGPLVEKMIVDGFAFDVELLFLAQRYGLSLEEVPVTWRNAEGSKVGLIGDPLDMLKDLVRVRWRFRRGGYNLESDAVLPS